MSQGKLLFDSAPLIINTELAECIGLNEAIILQQVHYWIETNKKHKRNHRDGRCWMFNTLDQWQEQFPFWSMSTIKRTIASLKNKHLLITGNYNKMKLDRTIWYSIDYERLYAENPTKSPLGQNDPMDKVNLNQPITRDYTENPDVFEIAAPLPPGIYDTEQSRNQVFSNADLEIIKHDMQRIR